LSTIKGNKSIYIVSFAVMFIVSSFFMVFGATKNAEAPKVSAQSLNQNVTDSTTVSYDVNAIVAAEIEKIVKYVEETERQKQEAAVQASAQAPRIKPNFDPGDGSRWDQLAQCESGGNWATNTGNGFGGGLQFMHQSSYSTWLSFGGGEFAPHPWEASREQQIVVAEKVLASSGWRAWPGCSRKFGWL
jgi:hypothetical protein